MREVQNGAYGAALKGDAAAVETARARSVHAVADVLRSCRGSRGAAVHAQGTTASKPLSIRPAGGSPRRATLPLDVIAYQIQGEDTGVRTCPGRPVSDPTDPGRSPGGRMGKDKSQRVHVRFLQVGPSPGALQRRAPADMADPTETDLRDHVAADLTLLEAGLTLVTTEFPLPNAVGTRGRVDILARDRHGMWVVIELKRSNTSAREALHELAKYVELL